LSLAFAHVGNGTDYFSISPPFFGRRVIDVQSPKRRPPTTALSKKLHSLPSSIRRIIHLEGGWCWLSRLVATEDRLTMTIWSGGAAAGLYLGTGLILAFLVHTHYPGALGLREWIPVVLSWPLIFFLRSK
jgi:hypothetical protein